MIMLSRQLIFYKGFWMKKSKGLQSFLILILLLIVLILGIRSYKDYLLAAPDPKNTQTERFIIYKGESLGEVTGRLEKEHLIRSATFFNMMAKNTGLAEKVQAGEFELSPSMRAEEMLKELTVGSVGKWVTLLEGWRVEEIAAKMNAELGVKTEEFLKFAIEGYMFPDTYIFDPKKDPSYFVKMMRDNFDKKYDETLQNKIKKLGLTPREGVILASIVEREARSDEARRMVASILLKRLKIGMGLNTDATIQYALVPQGAKNPPAGGWWKRALTKTDLKIDSPYNTYIHVGLPPTPISNPSLSSLNAVANADPKTPYLYYYHDSKGTSHYARTLDEHNRNVSEYP